MARGVPYDVEALLVDALLLQGSDHAFDHAVLLRAAGRDELLAQAVPIEVTRVQTTWQCQFRCAMPMVRMQKGGLPSPH